MKGVVFGGLGPLDSKSVNAEVWVTASAMRAESFSWSSIQQTKIQQKKRFFNSGDHYRWLIKWGDPNHLLTGVILQVQGDEAILNYVGGIIKLDAKICCTGHFGLIFSQEVLGLVVMYFMAPGSKLNKRRATLTRNE